MNKWLLQLFVALFLFVPGLARAQELRSIAAPASVRAGSVGGSAEASATAELFRQQMAAAALVDPHRKDQPQPVTEMAGVGVGMSEEG